MTSKKYILGALAGSLACTGSAQAMLFLRGELDFGAALETGGFEIEAHAVRGFFEDPMSMSGEREITNMDGEVFEADEVSVSVPDILRTGVSSDIAAAGVSSGDNLWVLPQTENLNAPFVALASEELNPMDWSSTFITFTLDSVVSPSGNGTFSMWESGALPGDPVTFHFSSAGANLTAGGDNAFESAFGHNHVNWGFNEPGTWTVNITASGTRVGDTTPTTASAPLTFVVVPEPSSALLCGLGALSLLRRKRS